MNRRGAGIKTPYRMSFIRCIGVLLEHGTLISTIKTALATGDSVAACIRDEAYYSVENFI